VIGSGGREHALVKKLKADDPALEISVLPGNGGMAALAACIPIKATDITKAADWCADNKMDYVVVAPDDPLALGMVDALAGRGVPAFGPSRAAARIEASKVFAKGLMRKYGIPTAASESFTAAGEALTYMRAQNRWPQVVKADGLALGKGVVICQDEAEAEAALHAMLEEKQFGAAGERVLVEEFLTGPEVSVLAFCDGKTLVPMVSAMDHKRACDGDAGPNTGGMGCIAPAPPYTAELAQRCEREIFKPTVAALAAEGVPFKGCLYFGLMLCPNGPKVIEYNCRFGDPEAQVVLPLLQSPLLPVLRACTGGTLAGTPVRFAGAAACVVMASGGYPGRYKTGLPITGLAEAEALPGVTVYQAGTQTDENGILRTAGGRVLGVTAAAPTLQAALAQSYRAVERVCFEGAHFRRDIGRAAMGFET
jgi:phosphoribosylamine--glycine ligase